MLSVPERPQSQLERRQWELTCTRCASPPESMPTPEEKKLQSSSVYAITKKDQEELCLTVGRAYSIATVALRFFNVYGERHSIEL